MKPDKCLCLYVFVSLFGPDLAQTTIDFGMCWRNRPIEFVPVKIFNCSVNIKTKDCAPSRPFQHKLQHLCSQGKFHNQSLN